MTLLVKEPWNSRRGIASRILVTANFIEAAIFNLSHLVPRMNYLLILFLFDDLRQQNVSAPD